MILYLGRHGQSEANVLRVFSNGLNKHGLTGLGRSQAEGLAERMVRRNVRRIFSSPILRAVQTAEIVSKKIGLPFKIEPALLEHNVGNWEGQSAEELWQAHLRVFESWLLEGNHSANCGGGENYLDIQKRYMPFIQRLVEGEDRKSDTLLIGHGGTTIAMLPCLTPDISAQDALSLELPNTSVIALEWNIDHFRFLFKE